MQRARRVVLLLALLAVACGDDGEGALHAATPTPVPPNQFGFSDQELRVGAARLHIAPAPAGEEAPPGVPVFETFTEFDLSLACPEAPDVQLHLTPNALFDGVLTRPEGAEPFLDCGGSVGRFNPDTDVFADLDEDGTFDGDVRNPEGLEPFFDVNGNGTFDAIWLGGFDSGRAAQGVDPDAPPEVTALVISRGPEYVVVVTLDTIGNVSTHLNPLRMRIAASLGLDGSSIDSPDVRRIVVSSLHNHEAADTIGIAGPTAFSAEAVREVIISGLLPDLGPFAGVPVRSGIPFFYRNWIDDRVVEAVRQAVEALAPAKLRIAAAPAPMRSDATVLTESPADQSESFRIPRRDQLLMTDIRWPFVRDPEVLAVQAVAAGGETIATLVGWTNHVEVLGSRNTLLSADYAGHVRRHLERRLGGVGIFTIGVVGGLQTPLQGVFVPVLDEQGRVALRSGGHTPYAELAARAGDPQALAEDLFARARRAANESFDKAASLGRLVGEVAVRALDAADPVAPQHFAVQSTDVHVPLENPTLFLAAVLGVVEGRDALVEGAANPALVTNRPDTCGLVGCLRETITSIEIDDLRLITAPGELLPEYTVGRPRAGVPQDTGIRFVARDGNGVSHDFGVQEFAPITALRELVPGPLGVLGLAQGQLGYFIPQSDFLNVFEGSLPAPDTIDEEVGFLADLDVAPLLGLAENPEIEPDDSLTVRQIIESAWEKFPPNRYPAVDIGGVSLLDLPDVDIAGQHPNTIGNDNSIGPRVGHVIYNAMCDLLDDSRANRSCPDALPVESDPNE